MLNDKFTTLLEDLSSILSIPMKPDDNNSCLLKFPQGHEVQLELDNSQRFLVVGSVLGELNAGKHREDILLEGLSANSAPYPRMGVLSYSHKLNSLILFEKIELEYFDTQTIVTMLRPFFEKAGKWKDYLFRGGPSPAPSSPTPNPANLFKL